MAQLHPDLCRHVPATLPRDTTLEALAERRLVRIQHERPWAVRDLRSSLKPVLRYAGRIPVVELTIAIFVGVVSVLRELGLAAATIRKTLATARALLEEARVAGLITTNPAHIPRGFLPPRHVADDVEAAKDVLDVAEMRALVHDPRLRFERRLFWALSLYTGCRFGEVAALMWSDVDVTARPLPDLRVVRSWCAKSQLVRPATKSGVPRHVPLHPDLVRMLEQGRAWFRDATGREPDPFDLLAPRLPVDGSAPTYRLETMTLKQWHRDLDTLGIRRRRLHSTRSTFDTHLRRQGVDRELVRRLTHPPRASQPFDDLYEHLDWGERCRAVLQFPDLSKET
jgi:integrase